MKKIIFLLCFGLCVILPTACLEDYLDHAPKSGLSEEEVFTKYENFKKFFNTVYDSRESTYHIRNGYNLYFSSWGNKYTWDQLTDITESARRLGSHSIKNGIMMWTHLTSMMVGESSGNRVMHRGMYKSIRVCNQAIEKIDLLQNATQQDKDDLIGQAHFVRAFAHFHVFKFWGSTPYLTKALGDDDLWDIPRPTNYETLTAIAADMDTAAWYFEKANKMRRDPGPGQTGHLNDPEQDLPNGVTAKAFKARALLYRASPLYNQNGAQDWEEAAKANWEAIQIAREYGYDLMTAANYKLNYVGNNYSNEQLWGWTMGEVARNSALINSLLGGVFASNKTGASGDCPTQNMVDMFETKWGDPLNTEEDRAAATAAGHYNEQDPYANRDPRFYIDILYNTAPFPGYTTAKIYIAKNGTPSELLDPSYAGITHTGYYSRKLLGDQSIKNAIRPIMTDPIIRLGELYLNYAEAANEAYGPNTPAPGADMSAVQAINYMRSRWPSSELAQVQAQFTTTKEAFRPRLKNERTVELCFEGHRWFDLRRWMDAPAVYAAPVMGMDIQEVTKDATYPTGYKYTRVALPSDRQTAWRDYMYWWPFLPEQEYLMKNFTPNPHWE
ncbi:MAG: RagB/SusD family nutrient uptake outer membrane protein [Mangrovibacterium sp.]